MYTHPCGSRCQATWSALDCDRQLDQELPQTQPEPLNEAAPLEQQHGAGDASAPPAAMAASARNSTNSRGVPLWLEPPQTNLLFNSHAQAQVCHRTGGSNPWLTDPRQRSASHTFLPPWTARAVRAGQDDAALHLWFGRDDGLRQKLAALRQEGAIAILTMTMFGCTPPS